jgi:DNA adenine methylase
VKPAFRYPGSKFRLAPWIVEHLPPHKVYCEPFAGTLAVLFAKPRSTVEIVNDLNRDIVTFFRLLRNQPHDLADAVAATPWSREEYELSLQPSDDALENSRRFLVRSWQGYGTMRPTASGWLIDRTGKAKPSRSQTWRNLPERLLLIADRLQGVHVEYQDAMAVIAQQRLPETLLYVDPPYLPETRAERLYEHEMTRDGHIALLAMLKLHDGPVVLSGYDNSLYQGMLKDWRCERRTVLSSHQGEKEECLWIKQ